MTFELYTIGYATKPIADFVQQLARYQISAVADVRSVPYSRVFHDYHREALQATLEQNGLRYVYLGDELGPRSRDPAHYDERGQVQFDRLMDSELFHDGVERVRNGLQKGFRIALMCAEKDPLTCHRSLLIASYLERQGDWLVRHILHDGEVESQLQLEQRLRQLHGCDEDLFASPDEQLSRAYRLQWQRTSYIRPAD